MVIRLRMWVSLISDTLHNAKGVPVSKPGDAFRKEVQKAVDKDKAESLNALWNNVIGPLVKAEVRTQTEIIQRDYDNRVEEKERFYEQKLERQKLDTVNMMLKFAWILFGNNVMWILITVVRDMHK